MYKILVLNPGSTSTKVAYYEDSVNVCEQNLAVDRKVISGMKNIFDQMDLRRPFRSFWMRSTSTPRN